MSRGLGTLFLAAAAVAALASALVAGPARAQQEGNPETTPNQGSYQGSLEMQERERHQQEQIQEQQRQSQQQQNQLYDDALRNAQQQQATPRAPAAQGRSAHAPPAPNWAALPRLPAAKNPLLGGWRPAHAPRTGLLGIPIDPDCDTIEFTATTETASDSSGTASMEVDYRTDGRRVVVLPRHPGDGIVVVYEFDGRDRMHPTSVGCDMVRVGGANVAQAAAIASAPIQGGSRTASVGAGDAVMSLTAGLTRQNGTFAPAANAQVFITTHNATKSLEAAGFRSQQGVPTIDVWQAACRASLEACRVGIKAMTADPVVVTKTDAAGRAQAPAVPAGWYYVITFAEVAGRLIMWSVPKELHAGLTPVTLNQVNAAHFQ